MSNMTARRRGTSPRSQALSRAANAVAQRDAERIERAERIQAALADIFQAQESVERIKAKAVEAAEPYEASVCAAVCTLENLGETRGGIAALTGLPLSRVREYLAAGVAGSPKEADGHARRGGASADTAAVDAPATS